MNLYSAKEMTDLLERHNFFFKKNLGQNFLMNESIATRIATSAFETVSDSKKTLALEIGPGAGSLTKQLSALFDKVLAIEIDPHLLGVLEESLIDCENVDIIHADALKYDYASITKRFPDYTIAVCSNLPYYITSELIMRFLECGIPLSSITVLIQKEAAIRLCSKPGSADYGAITAVVSYYAKAERLFIVGPGNFIPRPKVDSAVLRLTPHLCSPVSVSDEKLFFRIIHAAFANRRKTVLNALSTAFYDAFSKEEITDCLNQAGIAPIRRGETLSLEDFSILTHHFLSARSKNEKN